MSVKFQGPRPVHLLRQRADLAEMFGDIPVMRGLRMAAEILEGS